MSRKISIRIPDSLWQWLCARAGSRPVSGVIMDCLSKAKSSPGGGSGSRFWLWGIAILAVGLIVAFRIASLRKERKRKKSEGRNY